MDEESYRDGACGSDAVKSSQALPPASLALSSPSAFQLDRLLRGYSDSLLLHAPLHPPHSAPPVSHLSSERALLASLSSLDAAIAAVRHCRGAEERSARKERLVADMLRDKSALLEQQQAMLEAERRRRREERQQVAHSASSGQGALKAQVRRQATEDERQWAEEQREAQWRSEERREESRYYSVRAERERLERQLGQPFQYAQQSNGGAGREKERDASLSAAVLHAATSTAQSTATQPLADGVSARSEGTAASQRHTQPPLHPSTYSPQPQDSRDEASDREVRASTLRPADTLSAEEAQAASGREEVKDSSLAGQAQQQQYQLIEHRDAERGREEERDRRQISQHGDQVASSGLTPGSAPGPQVERRGAAGSEAEQAAAIAPFSQTAARAEVQVSHRPLAAPLSREVQADRTGGNSAPPVDSASPTGASSSSGVFEAAPGVAFRTQLPPSPSQLSSKRSSERSDAPLRTQRLSAVDSEQQSSSLRAQQRSEEQRPLTAPRPGPQVQPTQGEAERRGPTREAADDVASASRTASTGSPQRSEAERTAHAGDATADSSSNVRS